MPSLMSPFKQEDPMALPYTHAVADAIRAEAGRLNQLSWDLDSALSLYRKAQGGYRDSTFTGDQPWDKIAAMQQVLVAGRRAGDALDPAALRALKLAAHGPMPGR